MKKYYFTHDYHECHNEAIKEFAEIITSDYPEMEYYLNNLVKEMTEGKDVQ